MKKGILTFRSSLKTSAVVVKCGMTFLQCGHPVGEGEGLTVAHAGEAAELGARPGTEREAFPGASLHPTDCGGSCDSHPLHTRLSGSTCQSCHSNTALCVRCQHKGFVEVPVHTWGLLLPRDLPPHILPSYTRGGWGWRRRLLWSCSASSFHRALPSELGERGELGA